MRRTVKLPAPPVAGTRCADGPVIDLEDVDQKTLPGRIVSRLKRDVPLLVLDAAIVCIAYLITLVIRFEGAVPSIYWGNFLPFVGVAVVLHLIPNAVFGLYGQMWRYASIHEARRVILASSLGGFFV